MTKITTDLLKDKGYIDDPSKQPGKATWMVNKQFYPLDYNKKTGKVHLYSAELTHIDSMEQLEELWFLITNTKL